MLNRLVSSAGVSLHIEDVLDMAPMGWRGLVADLIKDLLSMGWDGEVRQVKEKFGTLRFYIGAGSHKVFERIDQAELDSSSICEECGKKGKNSSWGRFWVRTLCPSHAEAYTTGSVEAP